MSGKDFCNSALGDGLGCAVIVFAVLVGIGGCQLLVDIGAALRQATKPQTETTEKNP